MTKSEGKCHIDSVHLGELIINLLASNPTVVAKYALSDSRSGQRFGSGLRPGPWNEDTLEKLTELVALLERDICAGVFEGDPSSCVVADSFGTTDGVPGL